MLEVGEHWKVIVAHSMGQHVYGMPRQVRHDKTQHRAFETVTSVGSTPANGWPAEWLSTREVCRRRLHIQFLMADNGARHGEMHPYEIGFSIRTGGSCACISHAAGT